MRDIFGFLTIFFIKLEKVNKRLTFPGLFRKTLLFRKCLVSLWNVWLYYFWTRLRSFYCPCGDFHQQILSKLVYDKFLRFLKILIIVYLAMLTKLCIVSFFKSCSNIVGYQENPKISRAVWWKGDQQDVFFFNFLIFFFHF